MCQHYGSKSTATLHSLTTWRVHFRHCKPTQKYIGVICPVTALNWPLAHHPGSWFWLLNNHCAQYTKPSYLILWCETATVPIVRACYYPRKFMFSSIITIYSDNLVKSKYERTSYGKFSQHLDNFLPIYFFTKCALFSRCQPLSQPPDRWSGTRGSQLVN